MGDLFGTDGVRGIPGRYPLVPDLVRRLGFVSARVLLDVLSKRGGHLNGSAPVILMGRDPRASGEELARALAHGFLKAGCAPVDLGVLPTPGVAYLTPRLGALCGVMVSASHNPAEFNGIKLFTAEGFKMPPDLEAEIERQVNLGARETRGGGAKIAPLPARSTSRSSAPDAVSRYLAFLRSTFPAERSLTGLRLVVDCAHGAAAGLAPGLFESLGAQVFAIGCRPNGSNINLGCGALDTGAMRREVVRRRAHCGVSLDGDADRAVFADERGGLCDGDALMAMAACDLKERGLLRGCRVVLTVMSNCGMIEFLRARGISAVCVPVGDRNVTDAIEREGLVLGGENSGHIVFRRFGPTGDGLLTALQTLAVLTGGGKPLSWHRRRYRVYPQLLNNLRVERRVPLDELPRTRGLIASSVERLGTGGRVLVRYSGTEPLVRILVEGPDRGVCRRISAELIAQFTKEVQES